ncbi:MAG TPA: M36 family metallopeptidase, partial [Verrucomicrobiae bacterium]|nr:M36 family metallopeptidase [Verrucomicrobiae bacterium]
LPQAQVERDALLGSPRWISLREGFLTGPDGEGGAVTRLFRARHQNNDPHRAVKSFVDEYSGMFGHDSAALAAAKMKRDYITAHSGMRTTLWQQELAGIEIFDAIFQAHTTKHDELVNIASHFMPRLADAIRQPEQFPPAPRISAAQTIGIVCNQGKPAAISAEEFQPQGTAADAEHRQFFRGKALQGQARTRLVWLPTDARTLRLGWEIIATPQVSGRMSLSVVDATTGEMWIQRDLTSDASDATYRVFIGDNPTPFSPGYATLGYSNQPAAVSRVWATLKSLDAAASPQGWIPDGGNETLGNNVDAHTDLDDDNTPDLPRPAGSPARTFDFPLDLAQEPDGSTYRKAAVVNLFYWCNWIHDRLYQLGFTEAAGNFQQDNFGQGGEEGDRVQADAQDGGGLNNANFSTPPDGMPPRMQMYIYDKPTPKRDGDFDVQVVIHEYVHGLSRRLVAGGSGPAGPQRKGMSEGWCDFYALALLASANEDPNATYAFGAYVAYGFNFETPGDNYYFGVRRFPYCTDLLKNPLTFKDIDPLQWDGHPGIPRSPLWNGSSPAEVHNMGEVWCMTLWEARAKLIAKLGYAKGHQLMLQYVTDGMKLVPEDPTFIEGRDGILQAEQVLSGGTNKAVLWAAFAKRGMGLNAVSPPKNYFSGVIEDYNPNDVLRIGRLPAQTISGPHGGSFAPNSISYGVTNVGAGSLTWSVKAESPLNISGGSTLAGQGGHATATVTFNAAAVNALPLGTHSRTILFSNHTSGVTQPRTVHLVVTQSLVVAGVPIHTAGLAGSPFAPFTASLKLT